MTLGEDILRILTQAKDEIVAAMQDKGINASGRTARGFAVEQDATGMRLVLLHDETANYLSLLSDRQLSDTAGVVVKGTSDLAEKDWPTLATTFVSSRYDETIGRWRTVFSVAVGEEKFFKLATE